jgi:hypothetical protein
VSFTGGNTTYVELRCQPRLIKHLALSNGLDSPTPESFITICRTVGSIPVWLTKVDAQRMIGHLLDTEWVFAFGFGSAAAV